jgi:hypothetical protein
VSVVNIPGLWGDPPTIRAFLIAVVTAFLPVASCQSGPAARRHVRVTHSSTVTLSGFQACERLRADVRRTRGVPDLRVLRDIADHVSDPRLAADARTAVRDIGHTGTAPVAFLLLRDDCAHHGVTIPVS